MSGEKQKLVESEHFQRPDAQRALVDICARIAKAVNAHGIELTSHTEASLQRLSQIPSETLETLTTSLHSYESIIGAGSGRHGVDAEIAMLGEAFSKLGSWPLDDCWKGFLREGLLIEIYSLDMIQLYRNFEFFRQCSYDLLSLVTHPWESLYERPASVTTALFDRAREILNTEFSTTSYNLPVHVLKEYGETIVFF